MYVLLYFFRVQITWFASSYCWWIPNCPDEIKSQSALVLIDSKVSMVSIRLFNPFQYLSLVLTWFQHWMVDSFIVHCINRTPIVIEPPISPCRWTPQVFAKSWRPRKCRLSARQGLNLEANVLRVWRSTSGSFAKKMENGLYLSIYLSIYLYIYIYIYMDDLSIWNFVIFIAMLNYQRIVFCLRTLGFKTIEVNRSSPFLATSFTSPFLIGRLTSLTRKDMQQDDQDDMKWLNNRHCHSNCEMLHGEMHQNDSTMINEKELGFAWWSILETFEQLFMFVSKQNVLFWGS